MSALDAVAAALPCEVAVLGGRLRCRIRPVRTDLVRSTRYIVLCLSVPSAEDLVEVEMLRSLPAAEQPAAQARLVADRLRRRHEDEDGKARAAEAQLAVVQAGLVAVWEADEALDGGGAWRPLCVVADDEAEDRAADPPRMPAYALGAAYDELFEAIWSLTTGKGEQAAQLARFRGGP